MRVPEATPTEIQSAMTAAQTAFQQWKNVPVTQRVRTMMEYRDRVNKNLDRIAGSITEEVRPLRMCSKLHSLCLVGEDPS